MSGRKHKQIGENQSVGVVRHHRKQKQQKEVESDEDQGRIPLASSPTHSRSHAVFMDGRSYQPRRSKDKSQRKSDLFDDVLQNQTPSNVKNSQESESTSKKINFVFNEPPPVKPPPASGIVNTIKFNNFNLFNTPTEAPPLKVVSGLEKSSKDIPQKRDEERNNKHKKEQESKIIAAPQLLLALDDDPEMQVEVAEEPKRRRRHHRKPSNGKVIEKNDGQSVKKEHRHHRHHHSENNQPEVIIEKKSEDDKSTSKRRRLGEGEKRVSNPDAKSTKRRVHHIKSKSTPKFDLSQKDGQQVIIENSLLKPEGEKPSKSDIEARLNELVKKEERSSNAKEKESSTKSERSSRSETPKIKEEKSSKRETQPKSSKADSEVKIDSNVIKSDEKKTSSSNKDSKSSDFEFQNKDSSSKSTKKEVSIVKSKSVSENLSEKVSENSTSESSSKPHVLPSPPADFKYDADIVQVGVIEPPPPELKPMPELPEPPMDITHDAAMPLVTQLPNADEEIPALAKEGKKSESKNDDTDWQKPIPNWLSFQVGQIPEPDDEEIEVAASKNYDFNTLIAQAKSM